MVLVPPDRDRPVRDPDEAPVFVVGTGRSGTTLLRQMLDAHPRIHVTHEAAFYFYRVHPPSAIRLHLVRVEVLANGVKSHAMQAVSNL